MNFTLDQLEVLEAIHRFGSFAAAGKHLHRATSAVSYQIKTLETALGISLFDRRGRAARLTVAGELALEAGRDVLARSRLLERLGQDLQHGWEPQLRVVVDGALPLAPVARALHRFAARALPTKIALMTEYLSGVRRRFDDTSAHLMLAVDFHGDERFVARPLPPLEMVLVARPDHPLVASGAPVPRAGLAAHVEIVVADSGDRASAPPNHLAFLGSARVLEVSSFHAKRAALRTGIGFGWLPRFMAQRSLARGKLVVVPLDEGSTYVFQPALFRRRDVPLGPAARRFLDDLEAELVRRSKNPNGGSKSLRFRDRARPLE